MQGCAEDGEHTAGPIPPRDAVALDTNALDRNSAGHDRLVDRFHQMVGEGRLKAVITDSVRQEMSHPQAPDPVRALADLASPPRRPTLTHAQKLDRIRVRAVLRGDAPAGKHEADALHLSEAAEAGCSCFITADRRILRRRHDLRPIMPHLRIMTLEAFIQAFDDEPGL